MMVFFYDVNWDGLFYKYTYIVTLLFQQRYAVSFCLFKWDLYISKGSNIVLYSVSFWSITRQSVCVCVCICVCVVDFLSNTHEKIYIFKERRLIFVNQFLTKSKTKKKNSGNFPLVGDIVIDQLFVNLTWSYVSRSVPAKSGIFLGSM